MEQLSLLHSQQQNDAARFSWGTISVMSNIFLVVAASPGSAWITLVRKRLSSLGSMETVLPSEALEQVSKTDYRMIVVDAGGIEDMRTFIASLRDLAPSASIVVATASPTWQSAKEVFLTGADDYIRKSLDGPALEETIKEILSRPR